MAMCSGDWAAQSDDRAQPSADSGRESERARGFVTVSVCGSGPVANRFAEQQADPGAALLLGDHDEGTERDIGQQVQSGWRYSHAAIADRMAKY